MVTLPIPPSVNSLYGRNGYISYITARGKAWFEEAGWILKTKWKRPMITGDCRLFVKLYYSRRYDYDNCLKATNDLLTKVGVIEDDRLIVFAQIEKFKVAHKNEERIELEIEEQS